MASCSAPFRDQTPADVVRCTSAAVGDAFDAATSKFGAITIGQWSDMFGNVILVGVMLGVAYGFWRGAILSFNWITEGAVQLKQTNVDGSPETVADTASRIQNDLVLAALLTVLCAILAGVSVYFLFVEPSLAVFGSAVVFTGGTGLFWRKLQRSRANLKWLAGTKIVGK